MSSIRPLATITILAVVGVILYVKINEGPAHSNLPGSQAWQSRPPANVPALDMTSGNQSALFSPAPQTSSAPAPPAGGTAPAWTGSAAATTAPPEVPSVGSSTTGATTHNGTVDLPAVPDIPELPPLQGEAGPSAATPPSVTSPPANIPTAQYSGTAAAAGSNLPGSQGSITGRVPSLGTATPDVTSGVPPVTSMPTTPPVTNATEQIAAPYGTSAAVGAGQPPAMTGGPAPVVPSATTSAVSSATEDDRYGVAPPASADNSSADDSSFAAAWPVIEAALQRQELARAHLLLSQWYGDPSLTPAETQRVESLLSQLAGTVVYSTEHQLEPAYVVRPGDTLESIARQYNVPWQLLAKINGIPSVDGVRAGQQLKVVRGPFSAIVELQKGQLTLTLDGRYAGKFPVRVEPTATAPEGQWVVDQKLAVPAAASVDRTLVLRSSEPASPGTTLLIASGSDPTATQPAAIRVSPGDAEELSDILSVGSRVVVRR
jgi:LysM repeat protein